MTARPDTIAAAIANIEAGYEQFAEGRTPHPRAATLTLPGGVPAPADIRGWAAYDRWYPWYLSSRRSPVPVADDAGVLLVSPMADVLRYACHDSIAGELDDDPETLDWLLELADGLARQHPGHGVLLEPDDDAVCRMLWLPGDARAEVLWYENNEITRSWPFARWVYDLFDD